MTSDDTVAVKARMRDEIRATRASIGAANREAASRMIAARVLPLLGGRDVGGVLAYAATPEELDPSQLVARLLEAGARVAYPRVCGPGRIELRWATEAELAPGYCGILEPPESAEAADLIQIDLVLVPGVAFDPEGHRLGMGGGFYDRLIPHLRPDALALGLAFEEQVVDAVPFETHDAVVDAVVTPERVLRP
jgi:5-formyltetrahydrofolate cyclo-ligase